MQFADDTQFFHASIQSIVRGFSIIDVYAKASGAKINRKKTKIMALGEWKNRIEITSGVKWTSEPIKALGVFQGHNVDIVTIVGSITENITKKLERWRNRNLTLQGKVYLVKSIGISKLSHMVVSQILPKVCVSSINSVIYQFLWDKPRGLVNRVICQQPKERGGLNMINLDAFIRTKRLAYLKRILQHPGEKWTILPQYWLKQLDTQFDEDNFLINSTGWHTSQLDKLAIPVYYKNVLESWYMCKKRYYSMHQVDIKDQSLRLFGNSNFHLNGKVLSFNNWARSGIKYVSDVIDEHGNWISENTLLRNLNDQRNWMIEFIKIKMCIPEQCRIQADIEVNRDSELNQELMTTSKNLYMIMAFEDLELKSEAFWNNLNDVIYDWSSFYHTLWKNLCERKIKQFIWKLFHGVVNTESRLKRQKKSNGLCKLCGKGENENQVHLFVTCSSVGNYWQQVERIIYNYVKENVKLSQKDILVFCQQRHGDINMNINCIVFSAKWHLWLRRNHKIFEGSLYDIDRTLCKLKNDLKFVLGEVAL